MDYKTPGVYVEELQLIPPSVAPVATAIPAFIGHTALTADAKGATLVNVPVRITSMLEYTTIFGGGYSPASYSIRTDAQFNITLITPVNGRRYYLFDAMQHYFDNGGGPCYVVCVGDYAADIILGTATTGLLGGLKALEKVDEPTLLVSPDSVSLHLPEGGPDYVNGGNFHQAVIEQCAPASAPWRHCSVRKFSIIARMRTQVLASLPSNTNGSDAFLVDSSTMLKKRRTLT